MTATSKFSIRAKNGGMNAKTPSIPKRVSALDWDAMAADLDKYGVTTLKSVLTPEECRSIASMYERDDPLPKYDRHGQAWIRTRRIQILVLSTA